MEKQCISFYIYKPNDSGQYYTARIYFDGTQTDRYVIGTNSANIYADRKNTQNPLHFSITKKMKEMVTAIGKHFDGSPKSWNDEGVLIKKKKRNNLEWYCNRKN